jgi:hypothetical protein
MFGGVRFGGTITTEQAFERGFDHVALALGAGKPTILDLPNGLAPGVREGGVPDHVPGRRAALPDHAGPVTGLGRVGAGAQHDRRVRGALGHDADRRAARARAEPEARASARV